MLVVARFLIVMLALSSLQPILNQSITAFGSPQPSVLPQLYGLNVTRIDSQKRLVLAGLPGGVVLANKSTIWLDARGRGEIELDKATILDLEFTEKGGSTVAKWDRVPASPGSEIALLELNSNLLYNVAYDNIEHFLRLNMSNVEQLGYKIFAAYLMYNMTKDERYIRIMIDSSNYVLGTFMYKNASNPFDGLVFRTDGSVMDGVKGFAGAVLTALVTGNKDFVPLIKRGMNGYIRLMNLASERYGIRTIPGKVLVRFPDPVKKPSLYVPYDFTIEAGFGYMGGMTQSAYLAAALGSYILTGNQTYYETYMYLADHWISISGEFFTRGELDYSEGISHTTGHALDGLAYLLFVYEFGQKDDVYTRLVSSAKKVVDNYFERLPYPYVYDIGNPPANYHSFGPAQFVWYLATYRLLSGENTFDEYLWKIWSYVLSFIQIQREVIQKYGVEKADPSDVPSWYWNYVPYGSIVGLSVSKKSITGYPWYWEWGYYGVAATLTLLSLQRTVSIPYVMGILARDTAAATQYFPEGFLVELRDARNKEWFELVVYTATFGEPSTVSLNGKAVPSVANLSDYHRSNRDNYVFIEKDRKLFIRTYLSFENATIRVEWKALGHPVEPSFIFIYSLYPYGMITGVFIFIMLWWAFWYRRKRRHQDYKTSSQTDQQKAKCIDL